MGPLRETQSEDEKDEAVSSCPNVPEFCGTLYLAELITLLFLIT